MVPSVRGSTSHGDDATCAFLISISRSRLQFRHSITAPYVPSVLWRCLLGGRKGIRPVINWVVGCWRGYLSGARCRLAWLAYGQADATAAHCLLLQKKSRLVLPFWYRLTLGSPGQRAVKRVCVYIIAPYFRAWSTSFSARRTRRAVWSQGHHTRVFCAVGANALFALPVELRAKTQRWSVPTDRQADAWHQSSRQVTLSLYDSRRFTGSVFHGY